MRTHEQLTLPGGVDVDSGIANLLNALWDLGLRTSYSCEGTVERDEEEQVGSEAYILLPEAADAWAFFSQTLEAISTPDRRAKIIVDVRYLTWGGAPDWRRLKRGPAVTLELDDDPTENGRSLRGCVRFDPELMPLVEAAFASDGA